MANRGYLRQDYVELVVRRLPEKVRGEIFESSSIIVKTQEEFRLLERRAPQKLGNVDAKEIRAACLLEYVYREEKSSGSRLSTKMLAKAIGTSRKVFDKLHSRIGNFRGSSKRSQPSATSTIPVLVLRLVSLLEDPNGVCLRAERLFGEMKDYVDTLQGARKKDQETDMKRFQAAYQAACLYHVVSKFSPRRLAARVTFQQHLRRRKQRIRESIRRHVRQGESELLAQEDTDESDPEDDHTRPLEITDIVGASPSFTLQEFKPVLKHVEKLIQEMEEFRVNAAEAAENAPRKTTTSRGSPTGLASAKNCTSNKEGKKNMSSSAQDSQERAKKRKRVESTKMTNNDHYDINKVFGLDEANDEEDDDCSNSSTCSATERMELEIPSFEQWREETLSNALNRARKELEEKNCTPQSEISDLDVLATAADRELRRFGLMTNK